MENNLKEIVSKKGVKHSFLAKLVGVSDTAFSYWIYNHRQKRNTILLKMISGK